MDSQSHRPYPGSKDGTSVNAKRKESEVHPPQITKDCEVQNTQQELGLELVNS